MFRCCPAVLGLTLLLANSWAAAGSIDVTGTAFVVSTPDGRSLRGAELAGLEIDLESGQSLRIDSVTPDADSPEVLLHAMSVRNGPSENWKPLCEPDVHGRSLGFPLAGDWNATGELVEAPGTFRITCTSGAEAKCVRAGYRPWASSADGRSLKPLFLSCIRMIRADYCGDGTPATRDGTQIDIFDSRSIQIATADDTLAFEAGWGPQGAVCVARTRIESELTLDALFARCPRLAKTQPAACTAEHARSLGAELFNASRPAK